MWDPAVEPEDALARVFEAVELPDEAEDAEEDALGDACVVEGWIGEAGPGWALRVVVRARAAGVRLDEGVGVSIRLRAEGRYVRSELRAYADKDRDVWLGPEVVHGEEDDLVLTFLPFAALPARLPDEIALEVQLTQDDDPIDERLYRLPVPDARARWTLGPFGAVGLAARAVGAEPVAEVARWLGLDAAGRAALERQWAKVPAVAIEDIAADLRRFVHADALVAVLDALGRWGDADRVRILAARLGPLGLRGPMDPALAKAYRALGVAPSADLRAVRDAYRRLARAHHPDRAADPAAATARMTQINEAYAAIVAAARARRA